MIRILFGTAGLAIAYYLLFVSRILPFLVYALICAVPYGIWRFIRWVVTGCRTEDEISEPPRNRIEPHV